MPRNNLGNLSVLQKKLKTEPKRMKFPGQRKSLGPASRPFSDYRQKDTSSKEERQEAEAAKDEKVFA